jgi:hypothetical protein
MSEAARTSDFKYPEWAKMPKNYDFSTKGINLKYFTIKFSLREIISPGSFRFCLFKQEPNYAENNQYGRPMDPNASLQAIQPETPCA